MQIDQKSMAPSQKKKELKSKLIEYNARYRQIEIRQAHFKSLIIFEEDMEFEDFNHRRNDVW